LSSACTIITRKWRNARDNKRRISLHLLSSSYLELPLKLDVARILLSHGADVNAEDEEGMTPAQVASARGLAELAELLSEYCSKRALTPYLTYVDYDRDEVRQYAFFLRLLTLM
jgi:hypothetical protein